MTAINCHHYDINNSTLLVAIVAVVDAVDTIDTIVAIVGVCHSLRCCC